MARVARAVVLPLPLLLLILLLPGTAYGAAPALLSVSSSGGHPKASWSLPPGVAAGFVEVGDSRATGVSGEFSDPALGKQQLGGADTSWRSSQRLDPGTYFVHVSGHPTGCASCPEEWSEVRKLEIRTARRYKGTTNQGRQISFVLGARGARIESLKYRFRAQCARGETFGFVKFLTPIRVRADGTFSARSRVNIAIHNVIYKVRGRLINPPDEVQRGVSKGIVRFTATRSPAGRCDSGPVRWTARGQR